MYVCVYVCMYGSTLLSVTEEGLLNMLHMWLKRELLLFMAYINF